MGNESKLKKNFLLIIILTLSGSFVYTLPYFRLYYYDAFMAAFSMSNTQMGLCATYYGLFGAVSYLIGGVIADKVSIKILIPFSLLATGLGGFYLLTFPSPQMVAIIHGIWGITSLMTFWPALIKALRMAAASNEQAKVFGIFEGGRGISNAAYLAVALIIFSSLGAKGGDILGVKGIIMFYSIMTIALGVLTVFLLKGVKEEKEESKGSFSLKFVRKVLTKPATWLMMGIIFTTYSVNMSYYYIAPYTTAAFAASTIFAAAISSMSQYIRPISAVGAGFLGDRINSSKVMLIAQLFSLLGIVAVILTPVSASIVVIIISCIFIYASMYMTQSMHFALMEETDFPPEATGTAIGLLCCIGYLPEALSPYMAGIILDKYSGLEGYRIFFVILLLTTVIGIILTFFWLRLTKVRRTEILRLNKEKKLAKDVAKA